MKISTAGESHGKGLFGMIEGLPAGLKIDTDEIDGYLALRQSGYGRGARQKIEHDRVEILSGVRDRVTLGSPVTLAVWNRDYENWKFCMAPEGCDTSARTLTKVRPGHADLTGLKKFGGTDARNILERASARETAVRVAAGTVCRQLLRALGVEVSGAAPGNGAADWVYALSGEGARRIRGENLGTSFGRRSVLQELALRSSPRRADAIREIARNAVAVDDLDDLRRLADALDAFSREAIRSLADCEARIGALEAAGDFGAMERLAGLRDYAEAKGLLPERAATRRRRPAPDDGSPRTGAARRRGEDARRPDVGGGRGREGRER